VHGFWWRRFQDGRVGLVPVPAGGADVLPVVADSVIEYSSITDILISSLAIALLWRMVIQYGSRLRAETQVDG
jgi:hypothetical protein